MRIMNRVLVGIVAMAALPAHAQELPGRVQPKPAPAAVTAPVAVLPAPVASDFIRNQSEIGTNVLLMQRQRAELQEMEELIKLLGVDAAIELIPGADRYATSGIAVRAHIDEMQRINDLTRQIVEGKELMAQANGEKPEAEGDETAEAAEGRPTRNSGNASDIMNGPVDMGGAEAITRAELEERLAQMSQMPAIDAAPVANYTPVVSEIYGPEDDLSAVISMGTQVMKLRVGDTFQEGEVIAIQRDQVTVLQKNGSEEIVLPLR